MVVTYGELFQLLAFLVAFASLLIQVSKRNDRPTLQVCGQFLLTKTRESNRQPAALFFYLHHSGFKGEVNMVYLRDLR